MSASDQMRAMLDELMGTGRDGSTNKSIKFDDPQVCKTFLVGCCPHDVLTGTRADIGECKNIHDLALKADYEMAQKKKDLFYDFEALRHLELFVLDTDRRIVSSKQRLEDQQAEVSADVKSKENEVHDLNEQIGNLVVLAEQQGNDGNVDDAMETLKKCDELKEEKRKAEEAYRNAMPASTFQQQKLRVCEVCSAYLGLHDNDARLADHFGGKLHLGFVSLRAKCKELSKSCIARKEDYERFLRNEEIKRREDRMKRLEERTRERSYRRSRSNSPYRRRRSRSREHRRRSRSRDRHYRDREHSRHHRRSRDRYSRRRRSRS